MEESRCIFCNESSDRIVIEENGYKGRKCLLCGLIFILPRPPLSDIQALYGDNHAHISAESHLSASLGKRLYARHKIALIKGYATTGSLLELGAGGGYFLDEAREAGFEVYAIESNRVQSDFINDTLGIPCEQTMLHDSSFAEKKFDIIFHEDVISHFYDPIADFKTINNKLIGNGLLVFETGNFGDVEEKYYKTISNFQYPDHLFLFSENNLRTLLELTGFRLVRIRRYSILPQLIATRIAKRLIWLLRNTAGKGSGGFDAGKSTGILSSGVGERGTKQLVRNSFSYLLYWLRYKVGYLMPKKGRPQTVIVIAQKRNDTRI